MGKRKATTHKRWWNVRKKNTFSLSLSRLSPYVWKRKGNHRKYSFDRSQFYSTRKFYLRRFLIPTRYNLKLDNRRWSKIYPSSPYNFTREDSSSTLSQDSFTHLDSLRIDDSSSQPLFEELPNGYIHTIKNPSARLNQLEMIKPQVNYYSIAEKQALLESNKTDKKIQLQDNLLMPQSDDISFFSSLPKQFVIDVNTMSFRLQTFIANKWILKCREWWPKDLSEAGFYYRGNGLEVQCFSCNIKTDVSDWYVKPKENPGEAHARINPLCKHVVENFYKQKSLNSEYPVMLKDNISMNKNEDKPLLQLKPEKKGVTQMDSINLLCHLTNANTTDSTNQPLRKDNDYINGLQKNFPKMSIKQQTTDQGTNASSVNGDGVIPSLIASKDTTFNTQTHANGFKSTFDNPRNNQVSSGHRDSMNSQITFDGTSRQYMYDPDNNIYKYPQYQLKSARLKTFDNWKFQHKQTADILADTGYFYTGEKDIVRCFCCDLGLAEWDPKDDPWIEHARHSPNCLYLKKQKGEFYIKSIQLDWKKIYNPKHAGFDDKMSRLATFDGWRSDIEQTPEILADAGFFFTGEEDVVRCHYCDGGLRHWESGDIPWEEHAKWFPFCKFVIKMKGREYVEEMKKKREAMEQGQNMENGSLTGLTETASNLDILQNLRSMQFENSQITYADTEYYKRHHNRNYSVEDLVEIILESQNSPFKATNNDLNESTQEKDPLRLMETNRQLKERLKCIRCRKNDTCMLFVNCGHRVTCESCAERMDFCPVCDKRIKKRLKTFLS